MMKKNHFLLPYAGNKRTECETIYNEISAKINDIKTIVEPYCGTSAFSFFMSLKHPKKFEYILNDNNNYLIELYKTALDETKLDDLIKKLDLKIKGLNKEKYNQIKKENSLISWIIINKIYSIRAGLFPSDKKILTTFNYLKECPIINFLRNEKITFLNFDGVEIINKYKDNIDNFIFLDPPYLLSCNDFYKDTNTNVYEYMYYNKINNMKSLVLLCLESNWIIKLLFNNEFKKEYNKHYQTSHKKTSHIIITNFD